LYNFNGSHSVSAILFNVIELKKFLIIIGVVLLSKPFVLGCGLCTTPLGCFDKNGKIIIYFFNNN